MNNWRLSCCWSFKELGGETKTGDPKCLCCFHCFLLFPAQTAPERRRKRSIRCLKRLQASSTKPCSTAVFKLCLEEQKAAWRLFKMRAAEGLRNTAVLKNTSVSKTHCYPVSKKDQVCFQSLNKWCLDFLLVLCKKKKKGEGSRGWIVLDFLHFSDTCWQKNLILPPGIVSA